MIKTTCLLILSFAAALAQEKAPDPSTAGWVSIGKDDFVSVNGKPDTWRWADDGVLHCSGMPVGVMRTKKQYRNFEMAISWCHLKDAGNSGVFVWASEEALAKLTKPGLPDTGIEVQVLDLGYTASYEKSSGKKGDWFTCHGDVFPVGTSTMTPFPPLSPNGSRSFPKKNTTKGFGQWNHYLIRAVDGVIRLWVNGEEVSGGEKCNPSSGYLCLESEGSPIDFKDIKIREIAASAKLPL